LATPGIGAALNGLCYAVGLALLFSGVFHLGVFAVNGGPWEGPGVLAQADHGSACLRLTLMTVTW